MRTKKVKELVLVSVSGNSFGDQIIKVLIDGVEETYTNQEGEHVDLDRFLNSFKAVSVTRHGVNALNRIFG